MHKTYINEKIIGERLRKSRKDKRLSAYEVAKKLNYEQYQTITKFEKEQAIPSAGVLLKLCNLYDCEVGYLTGDFDCKKREVADIQEETGLSERAINKLRERHSSNHPFFSQYSRFYSKFICNIGIDGMLSVIGEYFKIKKDGLSSDSYFTDEEEALSYYEFAMEKQIMKFVFDFFENEEIISNAK